MQIRNRSDETMLPEKGSLRLVCDEENIYLLLPKHEQPNSTFYHKFHYISSLAFRTFGALHSDPHHKKLRLYNFKHKQKKTQFFIESLLHNSIMQTQLSMQSFYWTKDKSIIFLIFSVFFLRDNKS